jgi:hypothetical protein
VVEEASRKVEVTGSNHGNLGASRLYAEKCATCQWGPSYKNIFFAVYFQFLSADPENLSAGGRGDSSARQH